jgi:polyhydroxyalkanoate synthesis regulator phasin
LALADSLRREIEDLQDELRQVVQPERERLEGRQALARRLLASMLPPEDRAYWEAELKAMAEEIHWLDSRIADLEAELARKKGELEEMIRTLAPLNREIPPGPQG